MGNHESAERTRVGQGATVDFGVAYDMITIGKGYGACVLQKADLGHFASHPSFCEGGHDEDVDGCGLIRAATGKFKDLGAVDRGRCVRTCDHRRYTTRSSGAAR